MQSEVNFSIVDAGGNVVREGSFRLDANETQEVRLEGLFGDLTMMVQTAGDQVPVTMTTCVLPPFLSYEADCTDDVAVFTITNSGGPMQSEVNFSIVDADGNVVREGSFRLGENESENIVVEGVYGELTMMVEVGQGLPAGPEPVAVTDTICQVPGTPGGQVLSAQLLPTPTPTPPAIAVAALPAQASITLGAHGFPIVNMDLSGYTPETQVLEREPWVPIEVGAGVCVDWLVYHTNRTGDWEIFRLGELPGNPDADPNISQGVGERVYDVAPSRSPDMQWVTFASTRDGNWEIYIAAVDGSLIQRVTYNVSAIDIDPVWSPTGSYIAYESARDGNWEIYMVNVLTGEETRLTDDPANDINPFWSPDGTRLVFQSDRDGLWQIYELNVETGELTRLSDGEGDDHDPQYSFDGERVLFRSYRDGDNSVIYVMNADGSDVQAISDPEGDATNHVWSPDDRLVAYQSDLDGDTDIYVYDFESGETRLVTENDTEEYAPTWYCDAPIIVFTSDVTGDPNIFETPALPMDADPIDVAEEATQLTSDPAADQYPQNAPPEENASRQGALPGPARHPR